MTISQKDLNSNVIPKLQHKMKTSKTITLTLLTLMTAIFVAGLVAAANTGDLKLVSVSMPTDVDHDQGTLNVVFDLVNDGNAHSITWTSSPSIGTWSFNPSLPSVIGATSSVRITATLTFPSGSTGTITDTIRVSSGSLVPGELDVSIPIKSTSSLEVTQTKAITPLQNGTITVMNNGNSVLSGITLSKVSGDFDVTFTPNTIASLASGSSVSVEVAPVALGQTGFGGKSVTVKARASSGIEDTLIMNIGGSFCKAGAVGGSIVISDVDIDNQGEGDDDQWKLLDNIEIQIDIDIENDDEDFEVEDVIVEIGLFDSQGRNQIDDLEFDSDDEEEVEIGDMDEGEDETVTFRFKIPADFEDGRHKLTVKAYGDKIGESVECTDFTDSFDDLTFQSIDVDLEDDEGKFIAFDNIELRPQDVTCGDTVSLSLDVFNVGDEDQEQVRVNLLNSELNVELSREIRKDFDKGEGDKERIDFTFIVPRGLPDDLYPLRLSSDYDYRRGAYRQSSDRDHTVGLRLIGCQGGLGPATGNIASITATLGSDAKAGEELIVKSRITNLKSETASFIVDTSGFESWASLDSISNRLLTLNAGESRDVSFTFDVDDDASGQVSFVIEVQSGDEMASREVAVNIASKTGTSGGLDLGDNSLIWVIGIINLVLIILIIIIAVRISRR
jgi:hypothetical protein